MATTPCRNARPTAVPTLAWVLRGAGHLAPGLSQCWAAPAGRMVPSPGITHPTAAGTKDSSLQRARADLLLYRQGN